MKVLMLGWELPPHHTGGLGIACYQMSKHLASNGVDIEFILPYTANFSIPFMKVTAAHPRSVREIQTAGGIYESQKFKLLFDDGTEEYSDLRSQQEEYIACVSSMVKYAEFDILHAHDWLTFRAAMAAKQISGKPLIVHVHSTEHDRSGGGHGNPLVREIEYTGLMMADRVFAVSNATKNIIVSQYGVHPDKIDVVHNRIEIHADWQIPQENAYKYLQSMKQYGYKVIVSAGRLTIQKGIPFLLEAAKIVIEKNPKALFLIVGSGEQYNELVAQSAELGIAKNILFSGYRNGTGKAWRDGFKIGDVFVMPSVSEPFGITPLESIAYETPVIISKQSGVSEVLDNALKVDYWDTHALADKILAVIEHQGLMETLRDNSRHELHQLSWQDSAKSMIRSYQRHISGASL